jgi:hypothetical protein
MKDCYTATYIYIWISGLVVKAHGLYAKDMSSNLTPKKIATNFMFNFFLPVINDFIHTSHEIPSILTTTDQLFLTT